MPYQPPAAEPVPADGTLPEPARAELGSRPFGVYIHVPFCATRCGYCDFNTYTAGELRGVDVRGTYVDAVRAELELARAVLGPDAPAADTVFVGGGTPTLLDADELGELLEAIRDTVGLAPGAEVTTEANPESVDAASLAALRAVGFTRVSLGMQSDAPHVLAVLERAHTPGRAAEAAREARAAGFDHVSLDLIYGTPGETAEDWRRTLDAALEGEPDHVSAYALIVEPGTRLHTQVRRGAVAPPEDDAMAERYAVADEVLTAAGLGWYEISNWASGPDARCRHNIGYWRGADWWGAGPGAHSHVGGVRWWNVLHPAAYAAALQHGRAPAAGREVLDADTRRFERVMLEVRLAEGLDTSLLPPAARAALPSLAGLAEVRDDRVVLTREGRLKADAVARALTD